MSAGEMRIVSLLASGTELVAALGAGDQLVGRSHECDHPDWVRRLPVLSRPTFDIEGSSGEVDRRVREKLHAGEPLYQVDEAALAALAPDVVITQTHCEVCAVGPDALTGTAAHALPALRRHRVATFQGGTLDGVLADFERVAAVIDRVEAGRQLVAELRARMARWRAKTAALPRPRVVCLEWTDPPFAMGNWGPELVALAGGEDALGTPGVHSRAIDWQDVVAADPDVLVIAPCGFALPRARLDLPDLQARPGWSDLRAVRSGRAFVADGNLYFNRSGPSLFATVDRLAEMLHPEQFGHSWDGRDYDRVGAGGPKR
jgi:iron complex transport system substrate-binding protein